MAGIDQNTLWQLASMILGKTKAQPTTRERATFLRTDQDGTQWVRLPSSNDETPVNGRTLATAKAGDTVEWSIDNGRLSITGNSTSPSVGRDYVGQEVSVVTKRVDAVKADVIEINELLATKATITELEAESARIDTIEADVADIDEIRANSAKVQNLTAAQLEADHAKVGQLDVSQIAADHATIGNLDTTYMHANMSNSDVAWIENGTIKDGAIVSAMINDVSANKLTAGTINGSVINVTNLNADNITAGTINGQRIGEGSLSLDKLSEDVYTEAEVDTIVDGLNDRIDGAIETHTGTAVPTLNNQPASSWNTTALKDEHVGDVYYVVNSQSQQNGYCYRFTKSGSTYSWQLIKDSDVTAALSRLNTAEDKITSIESFDSTVSSFMTNTDSELTSVKSRATSLETRMTDAEGDISEKVDTSTFNTLSQTVDENSTSITSMGTVLSNNGLTSSTNITNTVNTVSQTATGNSSKITQLTTTLGTNADGTTKTGDVVHRTSAVEQDLSGFKTTVSQTYATNTTVDGIATRVSTAESNITQNANNIALKVSESDVTGNYVVGKINLNSTTASIAASHINLQGAVTISDLASDASNALTDAAKTATNYATDITGGGVMVHPSDDATTGVQITSDVDIMRDGTSVINIGTNDAVRIGVDDNAHVKMNLEQNGMGIENESGSEIFAVDSGSTGSATVVVEAVLVTWSTTASVDTTTRTVSDAGTAAGTTTVTATINGSEYALGSTYATATVTAGTGVSVALTSAGVTYVQGLMVETVEGEDGPVTTTYPCELSVEYQHTVTDKATMSLTGSQTIGGEGAIIYMVNDKWSSTRNTSTLIRARNAATGREVQFGIATDGRGRGIWDSYKRSWLIYRDANDKTVIGGPNFSVDANGYVKSNGETVSGGLLVNNGWAKNRIANWSSSNQKNVFWWSENTATGERLGFGIADSGYNRGIWDAAKSRWIVVKNQSDQVTYYGLRSNIEIDAATILSGSTSISAGGIQTGTTSITRSGWYPFAISGWNANTRYALPARLYLSARGNGTGTVSWGIYNPSSSAQTPTVTAYVLWVRGD